MSAECARCGKILTQVQQWNHAKYCSEDCSNKHKQEKRKANLDSERIEVWACGGGVQSTAIAALIVMGKLPKPAYAWIVDVGYEKASTWLYCYDVLMPELSKVGVTLNVLKTTDYLDNELVKDGHVVLPAYRRSDQLGIKTKFDTHCSEGWKRRVANKWLKSRGVQRCNTWLGFSTDEIRRARRPTVWWNQNRYPLIEMGFDRGKCQWLIGTIGWPTPPRTSCYLCPNQNDASWIDLKHSWPEDFGKAVEAEARIQESSPDVYLHEFCQPLATIAFRNQDRMQAECYGSDRFCWTA